MVINATNVKRYLKEFDFCALFVEELGWDHHAATLQLTVDGQSFTLTALANKRGMVAFRCAASGDGHIPKYATRRKIEQQVAKSIHEHLIIYTDPAQTTQVWQWVKREAGKPAACREHTYHRSQSGDALIQKLEVLAFTLEEEETLTLPDVIVRVRAGLDVEKVTKKFYDRFKAEHAAFLKLIRGIPDEEMERWYVSVMLNRLMFIYFIQKKGFLDEDTNYLRNRLATSRKTGKDRFYLDFLCPLFFEGFAKREGERSTATNGLLGKVPYLNGGLFLRHQIEERYGKDIQIPDVAFEKIFVFFDEYQWHLDERPLRMIGKSIPMCWATSLKSTSTKSRWARTIRKRTSPAISARTPSFPSSWMQPDRNAKLHSRARIPYGACCESIRTAIFTTPSSMASHCHCRMRSRRD